MFDYQTSIYRKRLKWYYILPVFVLLAVMGSFMFFGYEDATHEEISQFEMKYSRDFRRTERSSDIGDITKCQTAISDSYFANCTDFCSNLKERLDKVNSSQQTGLLKFVNIILIVLCVLGLIALIFFIVYACRKSKPKERTIIEQPRPLPDAVVQKPVPPEKSASMPQEVSDIDAEKYSLEEVVNPAVPNPPGFKPKNPKYSEADYLKLQAHIRKRTRQHKSDTRSEKFQKKGPIFIPREPNIPPAAVLPNNITLDNVIYNPKDNEMYEIGSDVDDIELEPSSSVSSDSSVSKTEKKVKKAGDIEEKVSTVEEEGKKKIEPKKKMEEVKVEKKVDKVEKPEKVENVEKLEKVEVDKVEKVEKPEEEKKTKSEKVVKQDEKSQKKPKKSNETPSKNSKEPGSSKSKKSKKSNESEKKKKSEENGTNETA